MQSLGSSGCSSNDSVSNVSRVEQDYIGLSEVSSYPNTPYRCGLGLKDSDLELGLSLVSSSSCAEKRGAWGGGFLNPDQERGARVLTAKDLGSSSSRASVSGIKRDHHESIVGDSVQEVSSGPSSQVVGWPPIKSYRINSLVNQTRVSTEDSIENTNNHKDTNCENIKNGKEKVGKVQGSSLFVKVNMDGVPIGRKIDLSSHVCYETLAQALEDMFQRPNTSHIRQSGAQSTVEKELGVIVEARSSKLLDGSSEFCLTYEDKDGDWMLVGDVPWGMFVSSVKRLRIMRTSEANGLAPRFQEKENRQRSKLV